MDHDINLHENISVLDFFKAEVEIDAVIFHQEFERYRKAYQETKSEQDLIFCFIFLQIYVECFLHQNMRRIIGLEFKPPRRSIYTSWIKRERRNIHQKIDDFAVRFFSPVPAEIRNLTICINVNFGKVSYIRNQLAHGHKIASWSDSDGNSGSTTTRSLLTESRLSQSIQKVNELGSAWNDLLDKVVPQCIALQGVHNYKFTEI